MGVKCSAALPDRAVRSSLWLFPPPTRHFQGCRFACSVQVNLNTETSSQNIKHSSLHSISPSGWLLAEGETSVLAICTGLVSRLLSPGATKNFPQCHPSRVTGKGSPSPSLKRKNKHFHTSTKLPEVSSAELGQLSSEVRQLPGETRTFPVTE